MDANYLKLSAQLTINLFFPIANELASLLLKPILPKIEYSHTLQNEIAGKVQFSSRSVVMVKIDHYRPRVKILTPSKGLGIPDEYTHYYNNSYYTQTIGIMTVLVFYVAILGTIWHALLSERSKV